MLFSDWLGRTNFMHFLTAVRGVPKWRKWGGGDDFLEIFRNIPDDLSKFSNNYRNFRKILENYRDFRKIFEKLSKFWENS